MERVGPFQHDGLNPPTSVVYPQRTCPPVPVINELVAGRVARQALHDVALGLLVGERDGRDHVGAEVDTEDCDGAERQWNVGNDEEQERRDLRDVARQSVRDRFLEVVEDQATFTSDAGSQTRAYERSHVFKIGGVRPAIYKSRTIFGRPFVKRFALCYRTVVCLPLSLSVLSCL